MGIGGFSSQRDPARSSLEVAAHGLKKANGERAMATERGSKTLMLLPPKELDSVLYGRSS